MSSIGLRLSFDLACRTVAQDFVFTVSNGACSMIGLYEPETVDGFAIRVQTPLENIRYFTRLLGENSLDDPESEAIPVFYATWQSKAR